MEGHVRLQFFPGSELSPPFLLGGIVDLDKPSHVVANVILTDDSELEVKPIQPVSDEQKEELEAFIETIPFQTLNRVAVGDIMFYTSRRRAMC